MPGDDFGEHQVDQFARRVGVDAYPALQFGGLIKDPAMFPQMFIELCVAVFSKDFLFVREMPDSMFDELIEGLVERRRIAPPVKLLVEHVVRQCEQFAMVGVDRRVTGVERRLPVEANERALICAAAIGVFPVVAP